MENSSRVSLSQLSVLTGKAPRTLKKALGKIVPAVEGRAHLYDPVEALPAIYGIGKGEDDWEELAEAGERRLDPILEKARLDKLRGDKMEIEVREMRAGLISTEKAAHEWQKLVSAFRARILTIPTKLAPKLCATKEIKEIERILKKEHHAALTELSQYGRGDPLPHAAPKTNVLGE